MNVLRYHDWVAFEKEREKNRTLYGYQEPPFTLEELERAEALAQAPMIDRARERLKEKHGKTFNWLLQWKDEFPVEDQEEDDEDEEDEEEEEDDYEYDYDDDE